MSLEFAVREPLEGDLTGEEDVVAYDKAMRSARPYFAKFARKVVATAAKEHGELLEMGPGPGTMLVELAQAGPGWRLTGLDVSAAMLAMARERLAAAGVAERVRLVEGDMRAMPFPDGVFDLAVTVNAIHHLDDIPGFLRECARVLKPGGKLVVQGWNRAAPAWVGIGAHIHTALMHAFGYPLGGSLLVMRCSHSADELRSALAEVPELNGLVKAGRGPSMTLEAVRG